MTQSNRRPVDADEETFSAWPLIITIGLAKLATLVVVLVFAWDTESMALIGATILPWLVILFPLLSAPIAWQWRLRKARRKREALQRAEWMVDSSPSGLATSPGGAGSAKKRAPH